MARTLLTATQPAKSGRAMAAEVAGDVVNGNTVPNSGNTKVLVRNAHATNGYAVTIQTRATVDGLNISEQVVTVPALATWIFGAYDRPTYGDDLYIDVADANLKLQVIEG